MRVRKFVENADDCPERNESSQHDNGVKSHHILSKELSGHFLHLCYMHIALLIKLPNNLCLLNYFSVIICYSF